MDLVSKCKSYLTLAIAVPVFAGSIFWFYKLYGNIGISVWDCYASQSSDKKNASFDPLPGYNNITYAFENSCSHGMIVCIWLMISAIGSIILSKLSINEKLIRSLLLVEVIIFILALGWLANTTYTRFSHAG